MKYPLTVFLLICFLHSFGQFAIVSDADGFLNVRADGQQNSKVIDKLENGHLIYCFEKKGNWTNIDYTKAAKELNGYVYQDRYKLIADFPEIPITKESENKIVLKKEDIAITISQSAFDKRKHKFTYIKDYPDQIELIDNQRYWGTDGGMPTRQFEKIEIRTGQKTLELPKSALDGLYEPGIYNAVVNYDKVSDTFYIQMMNSDGAGGYLVLWRVEKGVYKDRLVVYGF
ncbi:SH3 domain-containing protein [Chitinophaga cymbidii]|uniref:SH3b domain-containing protein n=1 Tax=Chitinophaga cymbidii TaxID=1096750 RepID=A0A512RPJ9_9BACT|nr:hypothetical protein [Chitinophaga cymbidii]GEP97619.1 hypothetical protein CCY01nite_38790 [Chitinophaga cymbidii]